MSHNHKTGSAFETERAQVCSSFPIIDLLEQHLKSQGVLSGITVGWHCHLTSLTALASRALLSGGARLILSECNQDTTNPLAVEYMRSLGAQVILAPNGPVEILRQRPQVVSDTGLVLVVESLKDHRRPLVGACEITTSGIARLRSMTAVPLPVVNINDCRLKTHIENFHGVGDGLRQALPMLTGKMWAGRKAVVVGYGVVGAGAAHYLRKLGANVSIVEIDPVRKLIAHYDGFSLSDLRQGLSCSELLVTATGIDGLISTHEWLAACDGLLVVNLGHWPTEVDLNTLELISESSSSSGVFREFVIKGKNGKKKSIYVATEGSPVNVVLLTGSPEPTLIHLTTEILCLNYLVHCHLKGIPLLSGEQPVPLGVERQASLLALTALGIDKEILPGNELEEVG